MSAPGVTRRRKSVAHIWMRQFRILILLAERHRTVADLARLTGQPKEVVRMDLHSLRRCGFSVTRTPDKTHRQRAVWGIDGAAFFAGRLTLDVPYTLEVPQ